MSEQIFEHQQIVSEIPENGRTIQIESDEHKRAAIAKRLAIPGVDSFRADLELKPEQRKIRVHSRVQAVLVRECVASLEPMRETINDSFEIVFDPDFVLDENEEFDEAFADNDLVETLDSEIIEIGELVIQQLSLAMAPFPRKPGAPSLADEYGNAPEASPFAVLKEALGKE